MEVPEGEKQGKKKKKTENLYKEIIVEHFFNLWKETEIQIQEAQRVPNK